MPRTLIISLATLTAVAISTTPITQAHAGNFRSQTIVVPRTIGQCNVGLRQRLAQPFAFQQPAIIQRPGIVHRPPIVQRPIVIKQRRFRARRGLGFRDRFRDNGNFIGFRRPFRDRDFIGFRAGNFQFGFSR